MKLSEIIEFFDQFTPKELSEDWDNVGLLLGDRGQKTEKILTCLTLTPDVAAEAIAANVDLIVSHHPILFRAVKRITADKPDGRMLLDLIAAKTAVFSPHTRYDSAAGGINQQLAELFEMTDIGVIRPLHETTPDKGSGRFGTLPNPISLVELGNVVKDRLKLQHIQFTGEDGLLIRKLGIACGAASEFMGDAQRLGCDALLTGESRFHGCLEARSRGMGLILAGHYGSERPAMESLAKLLTDQFPDLSIAASDVESDPVKWL